LAFEIYRNADDIFNTARIFQIRVIGTSYNPPVKRKGKIEQEPTDTE